MKDEDKTKTELIKELKTLRKEREKSVLKDITEHKETNKWPEVLEEKYQELFESMMDGLILHRLVTDKNGHPVDYILEKINRTAEKIMSWNRKDVEGKKATEIYSGDAPFIERYAKVAQTGKAEDFIDYHPRFKKWYEVHSYCPKKGYFANTFRDITERKQAEDELRLHAAMMVNLAEGVYLIGLDDLRIKWTNERFARMFGYDPGELVGKRVDILNAPTKRTPTETRIFIVDILKETGEWHGEVKNIKRDGTHFWCHAHVSLFHHPEYGKIMVSVHTDITERKRAEDELKGHRVHLEELVKERTRELVEKNAELERFNELFIGREFRIKKLKEKLRKYEP